MCDGMYLEDMQIRESPQYARALLVEEKLRIIFKISSCLAARMG